MGRTKGRVSEQRTKCNSELKTNEKGRWQSEVNLGKKESKKDEERN